MANTIKTALENSSAEIDTLNRVRNFNSIAEECYQTRLAEAEDEDGSFQVPEGWCVPSCWNAVCADSRAGRRVLCRNVCCSACLSLGSLLLRK